MNKGSWLFAFIISFSFPAWAQTQGEIRTNEKGEKVIVFPDGTWMVFGQEQGGKNYPKSDTEIGALNFSVRLTEEDAMRISTRRTQLARDAAAIASNRVDQARLHRERIEAEIQKSSIAASSPEAQRNAMRLNAARLTEIEAKREAEMAKKELELAENSFNQGNFLQELNKSQSDKSIQIVLPKADELVQTYAPAFAASISPAYALDDLDKLGLAARSPGGSCAFTFNGMDESTGRWRKELRKELLFTYTQEQLRLFLKDKDYLRCEGYMGSKSGFRSLVLEFTFGYPNTREAYGFIEKGSTLTLRLLNGQHVNLSPGTMSKGSYDTRREELTYRVEYIIDQSALGLLTSSEFDALRVFWSSGYEEYPVYNLDFFMKQLSCLEK